MAAASAGANGMPNVEGGNHLLSTSQYRNALRNFLTRDTVRIKGGKNIPILRTATDIEVANSLIDAIGDAQAGNYNGAENYPGLGGC
jgi:hypothetical protein